MELIAAGTHSIEAVCRESGMSILELAAHVCTPRNLEALARVKQLHAIEREMLLGQLRIDALMRLRELTDEVPAASADEVRAAEIMRKACVDILRVGNGMSNDGHRPSDPGGPKFRVAQQPTLSPASEVEILEALERLGEEKEEYPQIEDSPACPPGRGRITQMRRGENEYRRAKAGGTDSDRRESSVGLASKTSNRTDDFLRKAGLRCQWHPASEMSSPPDKITIRTRTRRVPLEICNENEASKVSGECGSRFENGHPP